MIDYVQLLKSIGLNESEAKVYVTSLEIGPAPAHILVHRSGFSRPATYQAVDLLLEKGLLTSATRGKRKVYIAEPPEKLVQFGDSQIRNLQSKVDDIRRAADQLNMLQKGEKPVVTLYEGLDGLKRILTDIAETRPEETIEISNVDSLNSVFTTEELDSLQGYLSKLKSKGKSILLGEVSVVRKGAEVRLLPKGSYSFNGEILMYGNKLAISTYKGKMFGVVIESEEVVKTFKALFDIAWRNAEEYPLKKG